MAFQVRSKSKSTIKRINKKINFQRSIEKSFHRIKNQITIIILSNYTTLVNYETSHLIIIMLFFYMFFDNHN